jgi:hypothetical protein
MYLRNFPSEFVKDGKSRLAYYSAEARDLKALGWKEKRKEEKRVKPVQEAPAAPPAKPVEQAEVTVEPTPAPEPAPETITVSEIVVDEKPDFNSFTRAELLKYALDRGIDLPNNALKAELVEACSALK